MTKTEAAAYEELGRTPEQIAAKAAELDVKFGTHTNGAAEVTPARARKPRSDKGSVKGPKAVAQAPASAITNDHASTLKRLLMEADGEKEKLQDQARRTREACARVDAFIDSLIGK